MQHCKRLVSFLSLVLFAGQLFAQTEPDITGLWKGTMFNDTTKQFLKYEIAISEKKGKLFGYTHTYFIVDDKAYHGVKKVKIKKQDGKIIIQDADLIADNYPISPAKGIRQLNVLTLVMSEGIMTLSGPFSTNRTKQYHALTGSINVQRKSNFNQSALVSHLGELGLAEELSFVQEERIKELAGNVRTEVTTVQKNTGAKENTIQKETSGKKIVQNEPVVTKTEEPMIKETKTEQPKTEVTKTVIQKPAQAAADIKGRVIETIQSVNYASDSLVLTLYDNGEIDGDTVSVLLNGDVVMPKVGLSTNAVRKTIYTKNLPDTIQLVMYAETLGSLPPNTGLLIVYDGTERYEIRFSGDLKKNAAIVFRRKRNAD